MPRANHYPLVSCLRCRAVRKVGGPIWSHFKACLTDDSVKRFWAKVDKTSSATGCWLYTGFTKWDGYGWLCRFGRYMTAHRYAWILKHGKPPEGMSIMHICDNPPCCNPDHLKLGTHQENMADMVAKGRGNAGHPRGRKQKLWPDRVRPVKEAA
jgi:hypothetical protein